MNTTRHNTYDPRLTVNDDDADIADILSGWCCPDEIEENLRPKTQIAKVLTQCYEGQFQDSSDEEYEGSDPDYHTEDDEDDSSSSEFAEESPWNTPSVRSESDRRENERVPKKVIHEYEYEEK